MIEALEDNRGFRDLLGSGGGGLGTSALGLVSSLHARNDGVIESMPKKNKQKSFLRVWGAGEPHGCGGSRRISHGPPCCGLYGEEKIQKMRQCKEASSERGDLLAQDTHHWSFMYSLGRAYTVRLKMGIRMNMIELGRRV